MLKWVIVQVRVWLGGARLQAPAAAAGAGRRARVNRAGSSGWRSTSRGAARSWWPTRGTSRTWPSGWRTGVRHVCLHAAGAAAPITTLHTLPCRALQLTARVEALPTPHLGMGS